MTQKRTNDQDALLRALWRDQMHVARRALDLSPPSVQRRLEHVWAPSEMLQDELRAIPAGWLALWHQSGRGHIVFTHEATRYTPGPQPWRDDMLVSVCYLAMADMLDERERAMIAVLHLLDHVLGSGAATDGPYFSEGHGLYEPLTEPARRFIAIDELGYGYRELGATDPQGYFAHTLLLYLRDARRLSVLDPLAYKLYHNTLMDDAFWRHVHAND